MEHSQDFPDSFHRVTIKGMCVRDGKLLMGKESAKLSGKWELPGGGLDFGEDIREGFKREVQEEMGLKVTKISEKPVYVWTHRFEGKRNLEWYYAFVVAYRVEFEDLDIVASDECEVVQFFSKDDLRGIQLAGQMENLAEIFKPEDFDDSF